MIHMQQNSDILDRVVFLAGDRENLLAAPELPALSPFSEEMISMLERVSRQLMSNAGTRLYPDVTTFAFWIRRASLMEMKQRFLKNDDGICTGRGVAFHIAPSNVPVNFAYTLAAGLLAGNANIVRVPSKGFPQAELIAEAFEQVLAQDKALRPYVNLVRYGRDDEVNAFFSQMADIRVIWGGDETIASLRKAPLPPRAVEITFADRYSLAVIDSESYLSAEDKAAVARDFYNDTLLTDQNACTSPRLVVWIGREKERAKREFWQFFHREADERYQLQPIQSVNKLASSFLAAAAFEKCRIEPHEDNLVIRVNIPHPVKGVMELRDNSGFFLEYDCGDIMELRGLCDDKRIQTIGYLGSRDMLRPLLSSGIRGVDRVVPIGRTMDFDLFWDGYDLVTGMTRRIVVR